jgi:hypothetical protein
VALNNPDLDAEIFVSELFESVVLETVTESAKSEVLDISK